MHNARTNVKQISIELNLSPEGVELSYFYGRRSIELAGHEMDL